MSTSTLGSVEFPGSKMRQLIRADRREKSVVEWMFGPTASVREEKNDDRHISIKRK